MSSGAAILRELQLRKRRQQSLVASQKGDDGNDSSSTATTANPTQWHSNKKSCHSIITVCTGINCGAGGMSVVNNNTNRTSSSS
eukprot:scaffold72890_cov52-Attheya_sp.AAC.9